MLCKYVQFHQYENPTTMIKITCPNCDSFSSRLSFSRIKRQLRLLGKRLQNRTLSTACFCFCCLVFPFSHKKKKSIRTIVQPIGQPPRRRTFASHFFFSWLRFFYTRRISLKLIRLCLTINNDRIWLLWNNGGNSFKIHAGFFKFPIIIRAADLNHRQNWWWDKSSPWGWFW